MSKDLSIRLATAWRAVSVDLLRVYACWLEYKGLSFSTISLIYRSHSFSIVLSRNEVKLIGSVSFGGGVVHPPCLWDEISNFEILYINTSRLLTANEGNKYGLFQRSKDKITMTNIILERLVIFIKSDTNKNLLQTTFRSVLEKHPGSQIIITGVKMNHGVGSAIYTTNRTYSWISLIVFQYLPQNYMPYGKIYNS